MKTGVDHTNDLCEKLLNTNNKLKIIIKKIRESSTSLINNSDYTKNLYPYTDFILAYFMILVYFVNLLIMEIFGFSPTRPNKGSTGEPLRVTPGGPHASPNGISTIDYNGIKIYVRDGDKDIIEKMINGIINTNLNTNTDPHTSSTTGSNTNTILLVPHVVPTINRISDSKEPTKNTITINGVQYKKNNEIKKGNKTYKIKDIIEKKIVLGNNKNEYYYNINQFKNFINELPSNSEFIPYNSKIPLPPPRRI
jgi:hypothetical protein